MMFVPQSKIDEWMGEDAPYIDLTTSLLGIEEIPGEISYFTREDAILCGSEEAVRIMEQAGAKVPESLPTGTPIAKGRVFFIARGRCGTLNMVAKVCQNIFDNSSGIATKCHQMVTRARAVNPDIFLVGTRKGFPGTKTLAVKAMMAGGAYPHRLGLSETILVFKQHMNFCGGFDAFLERIPELKRHAFEKKLIVEADSQEECLRLCKAGVDGVQTDKFTPEQLKEVLARAREIAPGLLLLAAGGINEKNVDAYAATGVTALVTSSFYTAKPIDIGMRIQPLV